MLTIDIHYPSQGDFIRFLFFLKIIFLLLTVSENAAVISHEK